MPSVSVVIPTHNRAHTLGRALDSVYTQTRPPEEVIVVDDGSSDDTHALVTQRFPQARYLRQNNRGVSAARNAGIQAARGDWLALLDSDDEWLPRKLERQFDAVANDTQARLCHTDEIWIRNGKRVNAMRKHTKRGGMIFHHCLPLCVISPSSVLLHRSLFDDVGFFDETLPACEDYDLWLRVCSRYPVLYLTEALLVKYGGHDDQLSRRYWGMDRFRIRALHNIIEQGQLSDDDRNAAIEMLLYKTRIYVGGARKRGKIDDALEFEYLIASYSVEIPAP